MREYIYQPQRTEADSVIKMPAANLMTMFGLRCGMTPESEQQPGVSRPGWIINTVPWEDVRGWNVLGYSSVSKENNMLPEGTTALDQREIAITFMNNFLSKHMEHERLEEEIMTKTKPEEKLFPAENIYKQPSAIYLLIVDDRVVWSDEPTPMAGMIEQDAVKYVRADIHEEVRSKLDKITKVVGKR